VVVLHNDVLPFSAERGLAVAAILTDNDKEDCGTEAHPDEPYLAINDVAHRRPRFKRPQTDGVAEPFHCTVLDEFFCTAFRTTFSESVDALQVDLNTWLAHDDAERPHLGYRNHGKRPLDPVTEYPTSLRTKSVSQEC
jgi:hypothetical protein